MDLSERTGWDIFTFQHCVLFLDCLFHLQGPGGCQVCEFKQFKASGYESKVENWHFTGRMFNLSWSCLELTEIVCGYRAILFGKLLIVTGIPFVFEFISSLAEGTNYADVAWYWAIFDMINFFQGVYIFIIFVIKEEVRRNLAEDHSFCQRLLAHLPSVHQSDRAGQKSSPTGASNSEEATGSTGFDRCEKTSGL